MLTRNSPSFTNFTLPHNERASICCRVATGGESFNFIVGRHIIGCGVKFDNINVFVLQSEGQIFQNGREFLAMATLKQFNITSYTSDNQLVNFNKPNYIEFDMSISAAI